MSTFELQEFAQHTDWYTYTCYHVIGVEDLTLKDFIVHWLLNAESYNCTKGQITVCCSGSIYGWFKYDINKPIKRSAESINDVENYTEHLRLKFQNRVREITAIRTTEDDFCIDLVIYLKQLAE